MEHDDELRRARTEQKPRFRDEVKDAVIGAITDTKAEWRQKAQIGDAVVTDCNLFGVSVWQRNRNGVIERLDPTNVVFSARPKAAEIPETASSYLEKVTAERELTDEDEQRIADLLHRELSDSEEAAEEATWD